MAREHDEDEHEFPEEPREGGFAHFAEAVSRLTGRPTVFVAAVVIVLIWAISGPAFGFSSTWQLIINTTTTIITFIMVFLIQATQNRDNDAVQLKLDELIEATREAHDDMIDLEHRPEEFIQRRREEMRQRRKDAERAIREQRENGSPHPPR